MPTKRQMWQCWEAERALGIDYAAMREGRDCHVGIDRSTGDEGDVLGFIRMKNGEIQFDFRPYNKHYHRKKKKTRATP